MDRTAELPTCDIRLWRADAVVLFDWLSSTDLNTVPITHIAQKQALADLLGRRLEDRESSNGVLFRRGDAALPLPGEPGAPRRPRLQHHEPMDLDGEGRSDLHYAARDDDVACATALLADGADANLQDRHGFAPLHLAAQQGSAGVAELLLTNGAAVDAVNKFGNSPLFVAVFNSRGDGRIIELLRTHGADVHLANKSGQNPIKLARLIGNFPVAQFFEDLP